MTASGAGTTEVVTNESGAPLSVKDPLGRTTINEYPFTTYPVPPTLPSRIQLPEGNQYHIGYMRGSVSSIRAVAKPGTGTADITSSTLYETGCINVRICNRPKSTTDSNLNTTDFTYDPAHGGVLTETGPAVNGVRPQTRHHYQQRFAWIANGAGGYQASAAPIWVRTATSICRASAATGNASAPCAGGDEVLTTYDYGPDSGPNNLQVRGIVVSAGGESLRSLLRLRCARQQDLRDRAPRGPDGLPVISPSLRTFPSSCRSSASRPRRRRRPHRPPSPPAIATIRRGG